jgi:sugar phosphate permease
MNHNLPGGLPQGATANSREQASRFRRALVIYMILLAGYVLSFVHRIAPAAIAPELSRAFQINSALLGALAATYFYVYTVLQIPVGVLADTLGPRRIVTIGAFVAGVGSLLFGLAPTWELAAVGRTLVGVGVAVTFVSLLKVCANWFPPERFATVNGVTLLAGNLGAVAAGAPLAWAVGVLSWRSVFVGLGLASMAIGALTWILVRDRPEASGFQPIAARPAAQAQTHWTRALAQVLANPATWPALCVNVGVGGSYLAFAGLWVVPYLHEVHGLSPAVAAEHASLLLLGVAIGSLVIGLVSDRLRNRRGVMVAYTFAYALSWLPWLLHAQMPLWGTYAWCLVMGLLVPGFILTWTISKEANRPEHAGMAVSVVNVGIFLGAGVLQPLVGAVLDAGRAAQSLAGAWDQAIGLLAGAAALGALCTLLIRAGPSPRGAQA